MINQVLAYLFSQSETFLYRHRSTYNKISNYFISDAERLTFQSRTYLGAHISIVCSIYKSLQESNEIFIETTKIFLITFKTKV